MSLIMDDTVGKVYKITNGFEWKIDNFFYISEKTDYMWHRSPSFSHWGASWFLRIFPNGAVYNNTLGYINLDLLKEFGNSPMNVEYSFALKTEKGENSLEKQCTEVFEGGPQYECLRLIPRSELVRRRKTELLPSGVLTVVCNLKISVSTESARGFSAIECHHCREIVSSESISSHEKKCMKRLIKCPDCFSVILLQNWLYGHECQKEMEEDVSSLCKALKKVLLEGHNYDLILKVGDKELKAHQDILRARSQVFESMLSHDTKEKRCGIIDIPDCDPDAMEQFLSYIYSGKVDKLEENNMIKLYYIADKYDIKGLKEKCSSFIKKSVSATNFCEIIQLALNHSDTSLLEHATEYFINNDLEIMHTVEWQVFMKGNSTVANELTIKTIRKLRDIQI